MVEQSEPVEKTPEFDKPLCAGCRISPNEVRESDRFRFDLCPITTNGSNQFSKHLIGKCHTKKLKKLIQSVNQKQVNRLNDFRPTPELAFEHNKVFLLGLP